MKTLYDEWLSVQPLSPENAERLDRKMAVEFNYNSNHLEGNTLTYGQTELLLMFGETSGSARFRDYQEMNAHNVALRMVRQCAAEALSEVFVRQLGAAIFKMNKYDFRPNPVLEPAMMASLVDWLNATDAAGELEPLELASLEQIGGFVDYMRSQMEYSFSLAIRAARGEEI